MEPRGTVFSVGAVACSGPTSWAFLTVYHDWDAPAGTTRSRVNFSMNKFRKLGFIDHNGALKIDNSVLSVVLRD